jgi:hypothetical protein
VHRSPLTLPATVLDYLDDEVPWEMERFASINRLVTTWGVWSDESSGSGEETYAAWLRNTYGAFQRDVALDGAA